jgi:hypothetical protein
VIFLALAGLWLPYRVLIFFMSSCSNTYLPQACEIWEEGIWCPEVDRLFEWAEIKSYEWREEELRIVVTRYPWYPVVRLRIPQASRATVDLQLQAHRARAAARGAHKRGGHHWGG